ncbi:MarR family winged helix-turn-helix transcriptional regulator [Varunaivibrio sulfuroxidans]|uniref:DNA-binding MarR family transcriptional regulator n=1 Tax=Varunaivibrio sulfuroxidans TaxID=1773489 RepID=A0A4R3JBV0_9PROT|nr:MarR family transcriptional regulator [Varunaivibrio sulfuroxidans]TCS62543.1 DNA-binding MarR family transcriptional regulator [Varunaivibrio sulfuroxidans]WES30787.1 MarR family transcriptional regulator [Varunaivibrio sulfuroxidans]
MSNTHIPERSLGFMINDVARLMRRNFNRRVQKLGLSQSQWKALSHLARNEGASQAFLADVMEVQPITLARLIDRMVAAGWVERVPNPSDRRAVRLYITDKARPFLEKMRVLAAETREETLQGLAPPLREQLFAILEKMKCNLIAQENPPAPSSGQAPERAPKNNTKNQGQ